MPLTGSEFSGRRSALTPVVDESITGVSTPQTPSPLDSISNRLQGLPPRNNAERASRLPHISTITERTINNDQLDAIEAMMTRLQANLQSSLQQQQQEFERRMKTLLVDKMQSQPLSNPIKKSSASSSPSMTNVLRDFGADTHAWVLTLGLDFRPGQNGRMPCANAS
jgi:hypothetical protein